MVISSFQGLFSQLSLSVLALSSRFDGPAAGARSMVR